MVSSKPNIIISLPLVWSIRNFVVSGITDVLSARFNIYYAVDETNRSVIKHYIREPNKLITVRNGRQYRLIARVLRSAFLLHHSELRYLSEIMEKSKSSGTTRSLFIVLRKEIILGFSRLIVFFKLFSRTENLWFWLCGRALHENTVSEILRLRPIYILSTTIVVDLEWPLLFMANKYRIPVYTHILSFDNITSRGYIPLGKCNKYFVWNDLMGTELTKYYNVNPEKISITGTPQFDFHKSDKFKLKREKALALFGLESEDRYLLYCANHVHLTPEEPELLENIIIKLLGEPSLSNIKVILRFHPLDIYDRWGELIEKYKNVLRLSIPWSHPIINNPAIGIVTEEDMLRFVNLLRYADVVLNVASTIAIDASMTNTPVVCVGYHPENTNESASYYGYHFSVHYKVVMGFGATPLARNDDELMVLIKQEIADPGRLSLNRKRLASYYVDDDQSSSSEKLIQKLLND